MHFAFKRIKININIDNYRALCRPASTSPAYMHPYRVNSYLHLCRFGQAIKMRQPQSAMFPFLATIQLPAHPVERILMQCEEYN